MRTTTTAGRPVLRIKGANENNLQDVTVDLPPGLTAVVGVSGSGKSSLAFGTIHHEARRRFLETLSLGSPWLRMRPARVRAIHGLGPAVALGQNLLNRNPNSTVATASGIHPFLRLLYARFGERRCPDCGTETATTSLEEQVALVRGVAESNGSVVEIIAPLVRATHGSHRRLLEGLASAVGRGALVVDRQPWTGVALDPDQPHDIQVRVAAFSDGADVGAVRAALQEVAAFGAPQVLIRTDSRDRWLSRASLCPGCGAPFTAAEPADFHRAGPATDAYRLGGHTITTLLAQDVAAASASFRSLQLSSAARVPADHVRRRLSALVDVGLGYLPLDRSSPTLSRGEGQRLRIAQLLANPIEDVLHVLDEPTIGLDPDQVDGLVGQLTRLRGPVVMVEHDAAAVAAADHVVELGPGAGRDGGRVVFEGVPAALWRADTASGRWFSGRQGPIVRPATRDPATSWIEVHGASANNLREIDAAFPVGRLTVVAGPSGAGKSTLVRDVLVESLACGEPRCCDSIEGPRLRPVSVTQEPIGRNPRSNAATYSGLADVLRTWFARHTGEPASRFSFNRKEGACPTCEGIGSVEIKLPWLPSEWLTCDGCDGRRFQSDVLDARVRLSDGVARSIADVYELEVDEAWSLLEQPAARAILEPLRDVGLGYLTLGQASTTLSGGEAQRVKLARSLATARTSDLVVLDEPTTGLHPADLGRLIGVLQGLVDRGCTVVVVEHQPDVVAAADWVIRLGPGGGPDGGLLVQAGPPGDHPARRHPPRPRSRIRPARRTDDEIVITGATANNLRNVNVSIAKGQITGVVGVSGSGKSSLIRDVLEAEATRRYLESLSMYERQSVREGAQPPARRISGLGPTLGIRPERRAVGVLSTVGTATEVSLHLGVLLAFAGAGGSGRPLEPRHFSPSTYEAACLACHGVGTIAEPRLERLIVDPELPLCSGAMYSPGYYPGSYLCKPPSLGYWMLRALGQRHGFDPFETSWSQMSEAARDAFLNADEDIELPPEARGRPITLRWRGFFRIVAGWDLGGLYTDHVVCPACLGGRLRPELLEVRLGSMNRHGLHQAPVDAVERLLADMVVPAGVPGWVERSRRVAVRRLGFLRQVGLSHLNLDRLSRTLSAGETQRVRLASLLGTELSGLTVLLDEPTRGLHPREVDAFGDALIELRRAGNTVVLVDHDPRLLERVDRLVVLGPGAGTAGGRLLAEGSAGALRRRRTGPIGAIVAPVVPDRVRGPRREPVGRLVVRSPTEHNLRGEDITIPLGVLVGLCGVSGSGKSTLAIDTLARALAPARLTTSVAYEDVRPGAHAAIDGAPGRVVHSDQSRSGIQTPGGFLGVLDPLRKAYAGSSEAAGRGIGEQNLTPDCDGCHGRGSIREDLGFLPSIDRPCDACDGTGYRAEVRSLRVRGRSLPELTERTLDEVLAVWPDVDRVARPLAVAARLGLGYLRLGQPASSLSGGEAQRLRLCRELGKPARQPTLFILDEPTVGLHALDTARLIEVLDGLVEQGHSVLVVEHDPVLLACCDWLIELGPGGGPEGGSVVASGRPEDVARTGTATSPYLREVLG